MLKSCLQTEACYKLSAMEETTSFFRVSKVPPSETELLMVTIIKLYIYKSNFRWFKYTSLRYYRISEQFYDLRKFLQTHRRFEMIDWLVSIGV